MARSIEKIIKFRDIVRIERLLLSIVSSLSKPKIKVMILDVLKLRSPSLPRFATLLAELDGVDDVDVSLIEMDEKTESIKLVINGPAIDYEAFMKYIGKQGAAIHSVDQVIVEKDEE